MKIVELQSENVKRLRAVSIKPDGAVVVIKGNNGQGKTSVLDSIQFALGGKDAQPPKVIREGETKAQVVVDLGDLVVTRRWSANDKSYLDVRSRDGLKYGSPQAMLDKLVGQLSFDPLSFMRLEPKKQVETLRRLLGLDFSQLDGKRAAIYEERTLLNREIATARARLEALPAAAGVEAVELEDLLAEQEMLLEAQRDNEAVRRQLREAQIDEQGAGVRLHGALERVKQLEDQLARAREELQQAEQNKAAKSELVTLLSVSAKKLVDPDLNSIRERIRKAQADNELVRKRKERDQIAKDLDAKQAQSEEMTKRLAELDAEKERMLAGAKFPVEGLSFTADGLTLNGIPLEQASAAEQLRVSVAMGLALNPKLKVLLVRDGSLLDKKSLGLIAKMAEAADAQVWLEKVGDDGDVGVLIEDGSVVEGATKEHAA